jgi:hypothetical protein
VCRIRTERGPVGDGMPTATRLQVAKSPESVDETAILGVSGRDRFHERLDAPAPQSGVEEFLHGTPAPS